MKSGLLLATGAAALLMGAHPAHAAYEAWRFTTIVDTNDNTGNSEANGINRTRQIVGSSVNTPDTIAYNTSGFSRSSGGSYTAVNVPAAAMTTASGVNNSGQISGYYTDTSGGVHGFVQTAGIPVSFDVTGAASGGATYAVGINTAATTVGYYFDSLGNAHGFSRTSGGSDTTLDVTGLGTVTSTQAFGINDGGIIVGSFSDGTLTHGFVKVAGVYTLLDDPLGVNGSFATGLNNAGDVVGYYIDVDGITHGFVDFGGASGGTIFMTIDAPGAASLTTTMGINDKFQVVGRAINADGVITGYVADLPEPATLALFGLGSFGVAMLRRRRARAG